MKLHFIEEPPLEFGRGENVCPRIGIARYDVYDTKFKTRRHQINVGAVGTSEALEKLNEWLHRCTEGIPGKLNTKQPELFPAFCGFNNTVGFKADFVYEDEITRSFNNSDIKRIIEISKWNNRVDAAVDLYYRNVKFLAQNRQVDVVICIIPNDLYEKIVTRESKPIEETIEDDSRDDLLEVNFRRALKAKVMHLGKPIQIIRQLSLDSNVKIQQDDATKAWNFCTALYYKANKTVPWKLVTNKNRPSVCFVGIGFYRSRDRITLHTSLAQIFDELGNSVILRGTPVEIDKKDRQPHLTEQQSYDLLKSALQEYEVALDTSPARLVIHKSSNFNQAELKGFRAATDELRINSVDFVAIQDTSLRLLRDGLYPVYRGMHLELDKTTHLLYTRGSNSFYRTYPGLYIPQPLELRIVESDESATVICKEVLSLTKMNWNNTQFDGKYPITIECARKVGQVMKYLTDDTRPQINFSFYM